MTRLFAVLAVCLACTCSSEAGVRWVARLFETKLDDGSRLVVDKGDSAPPDSELLVYYWRLIEADGGDGAILYMRPSNYNMGTAPVHQPVDVLYAKLINGSLFTVYNQRGRCWATLVVGKFPDGRINERPALVPTKVAGIGVVDSSVGPPMSSAAVQIGPGGKIVLTVVDPEDETHSFELAEARDEAAATTYYWKPLRSPATMSPVP